MSNDTDKPKDKDLVFWQALNEVLQSARKLLPYAETPERIHWDHPDDDWKNEAEVESQEKEAWAETDDLIVHFCEKKVWPKRSKNNARYFAEQRLKWAIKTTKLFVIPDTSTGQAAIPRPPQSGWKLIRWLLIDVYQRPYKPSQYDPYLGPH